jgi:hypothetical protein
MAGSKGKVLHFMAQIRNFGFEPLSEIFRDSTFLLDIT